MRFGEVQLGDLGSSCSVDSWYATTGAFSGSTVYTSPEVIMDLRWNTASDIWSFGALVRAMLSVLDAGLTNNVLLQLIGLIYGKNLQIFHLEGMDPSLEEYRVEVLKKQLRFFFPFPEKFREIADPETIQSILHVMQQVPEYTPFSRTTDKEILQADRDFVCKIMKLDWRDRPTVHDLLEDEWWNVDEEPVRGVVLNTQFLFLYTDLLQVLLLHPKTFPVDQPLYEMIEQPQHTQLQQVVC